ncbi:MAG TPA: hypothetical protein VNY05_31255 [Candidatus Acidoferrales bacterium]|jgi:hypothetical protein|nr:hypothetical protein [Candidatus Acidoferrales bacterium]
MRDERYIEIPGSKTHELPPLLVLSASEEVGDLTSVMLEAEEMLAASDAEESVLEQRKLDLALQLAQQYKGLMSHWLWGDSILEWIRQCETTFESEGALRQLLHPDVWPHANRASFVTLLMDKAVPTNGVGLEKAVGLRLTFRQPPPIHCFSSQFLFYLNSSVAGMAYQTWSHLVPKAPTLFPPDRFHFDVVDISN